MNKNRMVLGLTSQYPGHLYDVVGYLWQSENRNIYLFDDDVPTLFIYARECSQDINLPFIAAGWAHWNRCLWKVRWRSRGLLLPDDFMGTTYPHSNISDTFAFMSKDWCSGYSSDMSRVIKNTYRT